MLTPAERKALKAKAHKLDPVVHVGAKGLTDEVIAEDRPRAQRPRADQGEGGKPGSRCA
jgi:RNA-binding protein YhbY